MRLTSLALFLLVVGQVLLTAGCATQRNIKNVMLPMPVIRKVIVDNIPGGVKKQSLNGREITSAYFNIKNFKASDTSLRRGQAKVVILGSSRPYIITIEVNLEKRRSGSKKKYDKLGFDSRLTKEVRKRLKAALDNRPADVNVIDDFRAF